MKRHAILSAFFAIAVFVTLASDASAMYHPQLGRFLTRDPVGYDAGNENLYSYVNNSPLQFTDPSGEYVFCAIWGIPKRDYKPTTDGCSVPNNPITGKPLFPDPNNPRGADFKPACDTHDLCYQTCNVDKTKCDLDFREAMRKACRAMDAVENRQKNFNLKSCLAAADSYYMIVAGKLGNPAFDKSQSDACYCACNDRRSHPPILGDFAY